MSLKVSIHQPDYIPWLPYFNKMKNIDLFVFLDCAQYTKNGFHNRNKIKTSNNQTYLTIPINKKQYFKPINKIELPSDNSWQKKHWKSILFSYSKSPYFKDHKDFFENIYKLKFNFLADLNIEIIKYIKKEFSLQNKFIRESELNIDENLKGTERLVAILKKLKANYYFSGSSGEKYLDLFLFKKEGIEIEFQHYQHSIYPQLFGQFIPGLSAIDWLFNCGNNINYDAL